MTSDDENMDLLRREAWDLVLKATSGHATRAELDAVERWRTQSPAHAAAFAHASSRWHELGPALKVIAERQRRGVDAPPPRTLLGRRAMLAGGLAAAAATVAAVASPPLGLWPSPREFVADYRTATGQRRTLRLDGDISVEMNTATSLNIGLPADDSGRIELVAGEAAVAAQRAVEVFAADGRTRATSAQFNVRSDGATVSVTCLSGSVDVECRNKRVTLKPNGQVVYDKDGLHASRTIDPQRVTAWRNGDLFFENEPLSRIVDEINRYRPGKIVLVGSELGERRLTARFKLNRLDVVFVQLRDAFGAHVTVLPGGITIVS